jgi:hypothetical protein
MTGIDSWIVLQVMLFVFIFLLAFDGAIYVIYSLKATSTNTQWPAQSVKITRIYLWALAVSVWVAVFGGAYIVFPWYRAYLSEHTYDLTNFPLFLTGADPKIAAWHRLSMDWITHVAALAPIAATVVAYVASYYGSMLGRKADERHNVMIFFFLTFITTMAAGLLATSINWAAAIH